MRFDSFLDPDPCWYLYVQNRDAQDTDFARAHFPFPPLHPSLCFPSPFPAISDFPSKYSSQISSFSPLNVRYPSFQCFGSIFIKFGSRSGSRSSQKSQSGFGSRKALNPDPDPSYFFTQSEKKIKLLHYYKFLSSKRGN